MCFLVPTQHSIKHLQQTFLPFIHYDCDGFPELPMASDGRIVFIFQGYMYFFEFANWLSLILVGFTIGALSPPLYAPCLWQWRCAWIATFTCWINFTLYIRRYVQSFPFFECEFLPLI
jgi:hypothetical protein